MARYQPKEIAYPVIAHEYRIVTPVGVIHCAYNDKKLALDRLRECPDTWRLIQVTIHEVDVTDIAKPRPTIITGSAALARAHRERGDNVTFIPLSQRA